MKKTILTFGLISGVTASLLMLATLPFFKEFEHGNLGALVGYTAIVLVALIVFFGIRSYRDNVAGGAISFGRGFAVGLGISLISCVLYVATWEVIYFRFMPGSMDSYFARLVEKAQASGGTEAQIKAKVAEIRQQQQMYENPLVNSLYTFIEPFPVDLLVTVISAAVLRKRPKPGAQAISAEA